MPKTRIAREVGLDRRTVMAGLAAGHFPERAPRSTRPPRLVDAYMAQIEAYYDRGGANAAGLARQIRKDGFRGTDATLRRALTAVRRSRPPAVTVSPTEPVSRPSVPVPSPRAVAWLLRKPAEKLSDGERTYLAALRAKCPVIAETQALGDRFARMLRKRQATSSIRGLATPSRASSGPLPVASDATTTRCSPHSASSGATVRWRGRSTVSRW